MATYKLIQDVEAEDHILGPLTLRQFLFGLAAAFFGYLSFLVVSKHVPIMLVIFLPPALFCAFFAFPFGKDQPTEIWFLAKLRFWFLPRNRVWNQSGVKELVTITAPKKIEKVLTNNLSQTEVNSRLKALASTLDSRGWAVKGVDAFAPPAFAVVGGGDSSDRLLSFSSAQSVPDDTPTDDVLDDENSPVAEQMDSMIKKSNQAYRQKINDELAAVEPAPAAQTSGGWFMGKGRGSKASQQVPEPAATPVPPVPEPPAAAVPPVIPAGSTPEEAALVQKFEQQEALQKEAFGRMHSLQPSDAQPPAMVDQPVSPAPPPPSDPALLSLAGNDDLNISTIAHEAKKATGEEDNPDEVVIKLH